MRLGAIFSKLKKLLKDEKWQDAFKEIENEFNALDHSEQENGLARFYNYMETGLDPINNKKDLPNNKKKEGKNFQQIL